MSWLLFAVPAAALCVVVWVESRRYYRHRQARLRLLDVIERSYGRDSL